MIPQQTVDLILDNARIDDVVSDFVTLKRRGANFVACCPFHNEKTPSFYVSPVKGIYKCFGCGKAGTAVGFVMEHEHCSYTEALRYLAKKYNIEVIEEEESAEQIAQRQRSESLLQVMEYARKFYVSALSEGEGRAVGYNYFKSRALEDQTIERFALGWAPSGRSVFVDAAVAAGYKPEYLVEAGLAVQYDDGRLADRFHDRVVFPIQSVSGRTIAFSCRTLKTDGSVAKYVNSPDTPLYDKSKSLYGIYLAKAEIGRRGKCYLAEGNVDVVTMHQLGLTNTVASCGTSLTQQQIRLIKKFTENVTIMYDGDAAGVHAALKAIGMILDEGMNVKVLLFPDGDDPDSFCRKHTLQEVEDFIEKNEQDFVSYMYSVAGDFKSDPLRRANVINDVADAIANIPDAVKREVFVDKCSSVFEVNSDAVYKRINTTLAKKREETQKIMERERRRQENLPDVPPPPEYGEQQTAPLLAIENRTLAKAESDLLYFMLNYGREELDFPSDSEYYSGSELDKPTVADFIRASIDSDGSHMVNTVYRHIYEEYSRLYDNQMPQPDIIKYLLDQPDRAMAEAVSQLSTEKYMLTVRNFEKALMTKSSWLVVYVPKSILFYNERRLQNRVESLRLSLRNLDDDKQVAVLQEIVKLQAAQRRINAKLGRDKK